MKHEVIHEYEKAKRSIFEKDLISLRKFKKKSSRFSEEQAPFHPVILSAVLN
jgi:hypothetical protein